MTEIEELKKQLAQAENLRAWVVSQAGVGAQVHRFAWEVSDYVRGKLKNLLLARELKG